MANITNLEKALQQLIEAVEIINAKVDANTKRLKQLERVLKPKEVKPERKIYW